MVLHATNKSNGFHVNNVLEIPARQVGVNDGAHASHCQTRSMSSARSALTSDKGSPW
jgi:hypothetical protein